MAKQKADMASKGTQNRAANLFNAGKFEEAAVLFRAMLAKNKNDPYAIYHVVLILYTQKKHAEALKLIERGVALTPHFAPMWYAQAMLLQAVGRNDEALTSYDKALELQPDYAEVLLNSGVLLREMFQHYKALERFDKLLQLQPANDKALGNCATILSQMDSAEASIKLFERLAAVNPEYPYGLGMLCYERLRSCDWTDFDTLAPRIVEGVRAGKPICKSFGLMAISGSASDQYQAAKTFAKDKFPKAHLQLWSGERYQHERIRIGYVSPDLREHPVAHLMTGIFERHDHARFETIAISIGVNDNSAHRARLEKAFDTFIDAAGWGTLQIAQKIRELEIDVLVDLAGYTSDARVEVFAYRPAPVQVTYLGYPGTLATDYFDYILADRHVIPPQHQPFYSEKVAYLPDAYLPTDINTPIAERTPTREECGLPPTGPVLCSFSHDFKMHPAMFDVWMRLLHQIPGSVLWLASRNGPSRANLQNAARLRGIDPSRIVFAGRVPKVEDHLARYRLADVFLDTAPYNAHTTAADALLAGLPVVTFMGDAFPARVAGSLL
ncbi:MAG TPA: tetratricopeptide repeat protein, partial [Rhizobacter sp.]|nr:tetratricopeptide repeat protein [Rhizobacter sp.]